MDFLLIPKAEMALLRVNPEVIVSVQIALLGTEINKLKPEGGTFCIQTERPDSANHNKRINGILDELTKDGTEQEKWKNSFGCPIPHYGHYERAINQMVRTIEKYKVDVFISTGGGSQFL